MKNSSRFEVKMARNFTLSKSGVRLSRASASTRSLKSSQLRSRSSHTSESEPDSSVFRAPRSPIDAHARSLVPIRPPVSVSRRGDSLQEMAEKDREDSVSRSGAAAPGPGEQTEAEAEEAQRRGRRHSAGNHAGLEQVGQVAGRGGVSQKGPDSEDLLQGAQRRGVRVVDAVAEGVTLGQGRDHEEGQGVAEVIAIGALALVPPEEDGAIVLVGLGGHDDGYDLGQEVVPLFDGRGVARQALVATRERRVHVVELIRGDPVVLG